MLDYILSKMVLLIFLLLLVSAFMGFRSALQSYFLQQHAQDVVRDLAERLRGMELATTHIEEVETYVLPRHIVVGGKRMPFEVNCQAVEKGTVWWVVFSVVVGDRVIAYDGVALRAEDVSCDGFPAASTSTENVIYMKKVVGSGGTYYTMWVGS